MDPKRKCYRMVGGLLCERTVEDVMPALVTNKEQVRFVASMLTYLFEAERGLSEYTAVTSEMYFQLMKVIDALNDQVTKKGVEINEYKEKHNIRIKGQDDLQQQEEDNNNKEDKRKAIVVNPIEI